MELIIRQETPADYRAVEELTREAFWNVHGPGCDEHYLIHIMRAAPNFIPWLDLVAEIDGRPVGHIAYMMTQIKDAGGAPLGNVLSFGPLSVLPEFQGKGVGSALICHSLKLARQAGHGAVIIYGDPRYYARFGFRCAERYDIMTAEGRFAAALLAIELQPGRLSGLSGRFHEDPIFHIDPAQAVAFDRGFSPKERGHRPSQDEFKVMASLQYGGI